MQPSLTLYFQTSYEFVQRWNSIPRSAPIDNYAELLKLIPLEQLPESQCNIHVHAYMYIYSCTAVVYSHVLFTVITNKLDGTMLTNILRTVDEQFIPRGTCDGEREGNIDTFCVCVFAGMYKLTADLLYNLSRVQRFSVVSMFLSLAEKQGIFAKPMYIQQFNLSLSLSLSLLGLCKVLETLSAQEDMKIPPDILEEIKKSYGV